MSNILKYRLNNFDNKDDRNVLQPYYFQELKKNVHLLLKTFETFEEVNMFF